MERSKTAKECKKTGGYFKCCGTHWRLDPFESSRNKLIDDGFIQDKKTKFCKAKSKKGNSPCHFCSMSGVCTKKDLLTGTVSNTFYNKKGGTFFNEHYLWNSNESNPNLKICTVYLDVIHRYLALLNRISAYHLVLCARSVQGMILSQEVT